MRRSTRKNWTAPSIVHALKLANESIVLLKNNGMLPIKRTTQNMVVVGPLASQSRVFSATIRETRPAASPSSTV